MNQSSPDNCLKIIINLSDSEELHRYQKSMINLLSKIDISDCNPEVREDVKSLYRLLSHLMNDENPVLNNTKLLTDLKSRSVPEMS